MGSVKVLRGQDIFKRRKRKLEQVYSQKGLEDECQCEADDSYGMVSNI